jgi:hypothetical protein
VDLGLESFLLNFHAGSNFANVNKERYSTMLFLYVRGKTWARSWGKSSVGSSNRICHRSKTTSDLRDG